MNKRMGLVVGLGLLGLSVSPFMEMDAIAATLPEASHEFYMYDGADIIAPEVEEQILTVNRNYEQTEPAPQLVVATVETLDGLSVEEYATELFEKWGIGNTELDNGVLLLISEEERQIRIEVGYGLEGAITDGESGRILDNNMDALSNSDYSTAVEGIFTELSVVVNEEFGLIDEEMLGFIPVTTDVTSTTDISGDMGAAFVKTFTMIVAGGSALMLGGFFMSTATRKSERKVLEKRALEDLKSKHPEREFSHDEITKHVELMEEERIKRERAERAERERIRKEEEDRYQRNIAEDQLRDEMRHTSITEAMILARVALNIEIDARRQAEAAAERRRLQAMEDDDDDDSYFGGSSGFGSGGGFGGGSFGGGGSSGGGGASRGF